DPATGAVVEREITVQARRVFDNLQAVLAAADCTLSDVVKTTVFLSDMNDFAAMNQVYATYFNGAVLPARAAIEVCALPKDSMLEVEAIACKA
ncbi:MAG: Rid family detoxifying hydrolase, partial [Pseudoflavonifractor sp.]